MTTKFQYSRWRKFLEPPKWNADSYVMVQLPVKDSDNAGMLKIADCDENIKLYFPWGCTESNIRTRKKIAILREALDLLEAGLNKLHNGQ